MFIEPTSLQDVSLQRSDINGSTCSLAQHCAPLGARKRWLTVRSLNIWLSWSRSNVYLTSPRKKGVSHEYDHNERRNADLLQGLGHRSAIVLSSWLALIR